MSDYPSPTLYIDGQWREGRGDGATSIVDPATGDPLGSLGHASVDDVADAIDSAARAFRAWRATPALERGRLLVETARLMRARQEAIARLITLELGKPIVEARREVDTAAEMFVWAAEEGRRAYGRVIPSRSAGSSQWVVLEPIGPVAAISGWNAPAITPSRKISGALAAGCTIVVKPSEETPGVALAIARTLHDAGVPAGVVNVVFGDPGPIARQLLESDRIAMLTFTGATSIGKHLGELAARTLKRATLELGGHAPAIVFADVDVERVARAAAAAKFRNAGQVCTSPTRFYIQRGVYDHFRTIFVEAAEAIRLGPGLDEATQMGPLKNERRLRAIAALVEDARVGGASIVTGGEPLKRAGYFYRPTVVEDVNDACRVSHEEPFGPIALLQPFDTLDEAIRLANRLPFGLTTYAFTRDAYRADELGERIESGVVCINEWQASLPETPFGGTKDSGLGSEGGSEGLREFQRVKCIRSGRAA